MLLNIGLVFWQWICVCPLRRRFELHALIAVNMAASGSAGVIVLVGAVTQCLPEHWAS